MKHHKSSLLVAEFIVAATLAVALPATAQGPNQATPQSAKTTVATTSNAYAEMMQNMQTMRELMIKIHATHNAATRAKLLNEHMDMMQSTLKLMMSNNGGCSQGGMMKGGMGGGMMQSGMGGGNMMQHQYAMQRSGH